MKRKRKKPTPLEEIRDLLKKIAEKQDRPSIPYRPSPYPIDPPYIRRREPWEREPWITWKINDPYCVSA